MPADSMVALLNGATAMACLGIALFFYRFWRESNGRLFACFTAAFVALTVNYAVLGALPVADDAVHMRSSSGLSRFSSSSSAWF